MSVHWESHVPAGRPLWSLLEDAVVEAGADGAHLAVRCRWGRIDVSDTSPMVREALHRMSLGPVALENIPALHENFVRWKGKLDGYCGEWRRLKKTLDQLGGCVVPSLGHEDGGGPVLSVTAAEARAVFTLPWVDDTEPIRLRSGTAIERIDGEQALVCPGAPYQVVLHRSPAPEIAKSLLHGDTTIADLAMLLQVDRPLAADVVAYLTGAGLVALVGRED